MRARCRGDDGQLLPLYVVLVLVAGGAMVVMTQLAGLATSRARARTAADAAALAGVVEGRPGAEAVAEANGARLESFVQEGGAVEVRVVLDGSHATARAERSGGLGVPAPAGGGDREGLAPVMLAALARADAALGQPVPVVSGHRSNAEQQALWERREQNPYPVARPGTSPHERGIAVDVSLDFVPKLLVVAHVAGLCQPLPRSDPIHFETCPPSRSTG